jgi:hypothetical protein
LNSHFILSLSLVNKLNWWRKFSYSFFSSLSFMFIFRVYYENEIESQKRTKKEEIQFKFQVPQTTSSHLSYSLLVLRSNIQIKQQYKQVKEWKFLTSVSNFSDNSLWHYTLFHRKRKISFEFHHENSLENSMTKNKFFHQTNNSSVVIHIDVKNFQLPQTSFMSMKFQNFSMKKQREKRGKKFYDSQMIITKDTCHV